MDGQNKEGGMERMREERKIEGRKEEWEERPSKTTWKGSCSEVNGNLQFPVFDIFTQSIFPYQIGTLTIPYTFRLYERIKVSEKESI